MEIIKGGITSPKGFKAAGDHIGLKKVKKDLSIIYSEKDAIYTGIFTTNIVKAASVLWNMERYKDKNAIRAVVINSGNANACTGQKGIEDNRLMAVTTAKQFNLDESNVLVASTGVIGALLPIEKIVEGINKVAPMVAASSENSLNAATGILTTDTYVKQIAVEFEVDGKKAVIAAMGKGSGMIHPNMATMLSFITTDVNISQEMLDLAVKDDIEDTYNMISVDGDTSTNDMVIALANGMAENKLIDTVNEDYNNFKEALHVVNQYISKQIINDGEGVTKVIEVHVHGAKDKTDARLLGKSVITSNLVKTAFFGKDANWGRILCAMGYSGAKFDPNKVSLIYKSKGGSIQLLEKGLPIKFDEEKATIILEEREIKVDINLEEGDGYAIALGCDLSYEYVKINGEYRT